MSARPLAVFALGCALAAALPAAAWAGRPTSGGDLYRYDASDVLATVDGPGGLVRVTYSVEGPNATILTDTDASGAPDFPEEVAAAAEGVLAMYEALGFRPPLRESDVGLGPLGGSDAFDFYLLDFGGAADGMFSVDDCDGQACAGHMLMENDFAGYGYPSQTEAIGVLTSHELFHAVQAAYRNGQAIWIAEGTAVWGEYQWDADSADFFSFCGAYLQDTGRSLDKPPTGPVPAFAYATALFWQFLTERYGVQAVVAVQEAEDSADELDAVGLALASLGTSWEEEWPLFVQWNLATGRRAGGALEGYPFASRIAGLRAEQSGASIEDENRFYPLAATYYRIDHAGGPLWFSTPADAHPSLVFSLHAVEDGSDDGPVGEALVTWGATAGPQNLGERPAGGYWMVGALAARADNSERIAFCLGPESALSEACLPATDDTGGDSALGDSDAGDAGDSADEKGGCGCASSERGPGAAPGALGAGLAALGALLVVRRRRVIC